MISRTISLLLRSAQMLKHVADKLHVRMQLKMRTGTASPLQQVPGPGDVLVATTMTKLHLSVSEKKRRNSQRSRRAKLSRSASNDQTYLMTKLLVR